MKEAASVTTGTRIEKRMDAFFEHTMIKTFRQCGRRKKKLLLLRGTEDKKHA